MTTSAKKEDLQPMSERPEVIHSDSERNKPDRPEPDAEGHLPPPTPKATGTGDEPGGAATTRRGV